ncbi:hypothetical protein B9Z55_007053 [Caenorhabditis nigoni]|nr:hypothetical protein B9Z55_007053 [Caenorhabditis nigoni]
MSQETEKQNESNEADKDDTVLEKLESELIRKLVKEQMNPIVEELNGTLQITQSQLLEVKQELDQLKKVVQEQKLEIENLKGQRDGCTNREVSNPVDRAEPMVALNIPEERSRFKHENMVSRFIPITYESLKAVVLHTDPNLRFKIAQRIPKIRLSEKSIPLRIRSLELEEFKTTVNSTSYKLGIYCHYHTNEIPSRIKSQNNEGGASCDLDPYGLEIPNSSTPILKGDVSFRRGNANRHRINREEIEQRLELTLKQYEDTLAKINQLELEGKTVEEFLAGPMTDDDRHLSLHIRFSKEYLQMKINEYRNDLLPFLCRRNNLCSPNRYFIQLNIKQEHFKTIQRYAYNYKLYEAAKKLNEFLFANRPVIIVNQFKGGRLNDVWRLPVGLKMSANSITAGHRGYEQIVPISRILDSPRTLRNVSFNFTSDEDSIFQLSFVKNAQQLTIHTEERRINQLARAFKTMENQQIRIGFLFESPSQNQYFQLIQGWLSTERSAGSVITFELRAEYIGERILDLVRSRYERTVSRERCVKVPLRNGTKLKVSYWGFNMGNRSKFILTAMIMEE